MPKTRRIGVPVLPYPSLLPHAHIVPSPKVSKVLSHRVNNDSEEYLIRWRSRHRRDAPCSWHRLDELRDCLHLVQAYIESLSISRSLGQSTGLNGHNHDHPDGTRNLKRKRDSPQEDLVSRDARGLPKLLSQTERSLTSSSRSPSVSGAVNGTEAKHAKGLVFNAVLVRKNGEVVTHKTQDPVQTIAIDATTLPSPEMREHARTAHVHQGEKAVWRAFAEKLRGRNISFENNIDNSAPSLDFTFVDEFVLRDPVERADPATQEGCPLPCKPNMGLNRGCEYTQKCSCLEYADVDEERLKSSDLDKYALYLEQKATGQTVFENLPKKFPYQVPKDPRHSSTLTSFYRNSRRPIYECNSNCNCGSLCKSRLVQKGRRVPLTIFKTPNRGWGVRCEEELLAGEFIDVYLGEVISNAEASSRETDAGILKGSYLYSLDKFTDEVDGLTKDTCHVVDGQYMGNVGRFINHSCVPNVRQHTVSYNKNDFWVYDLAFFAIERIPKGSELVFDYADRDDEEDEEIVRKREAKLRDPRYRDLPRCNCGEFACRGFLWDDDEVDGVDGVDEVDGVDVWDRVL
ncbi:hypothetical protein MBLNU230_g1082t1 [Neophaeotheca triangularis]